MLKIAHRGASGTEPENTIKAFKRAIELKVDYIECDVHLTKDKKLVVIHDETVDRTTDSKGKVTDLTLKEIKGLNIKDNQKIPTLEEVLKLKCKYIIELKDEQALDRLIEISKGRKVIISSKRANLLKNINNKALIYYNFNNRFKHILFITLSYIFLPFTKRIILRKLKQANSNNLHLNKKLATKSMINFLHQNKIKVNIWTVNTRKEIEKFKKLNVDGIFSNHPEFF